MAKIRSFTGTTITADIDGTEYEFAPSHTPADWMADSVLAAKIGDKLVLGYLVHDDSCQNPLEDGDGMGAIHHHPNHRYGRRDSEYYEALGLDGNGEPDLDLVPDRNVRDAYIAHFVACDSDDFLEVLDRDIDAREEGESEEDYRLRCATVDFDNVYGGKLFYEAYDELRLAEWHRLRDAGEIGDPDAVLLDLYEHSGVAYSVMGQGMNCRWDTSRGAAVWVPDDYARQEIDRRAKVYAFGHIEDLQLRGPRKLRYHAIPTGTASLGSFEHRHEAFKALEEYSKVFAATPEMLAAGRVRAAEELASQACETYTSWANGDCYGIVVELHEPVPGVDGDTCFVEELSSCWGFIGGDWAEEDLKSSWQYYVNEYTKQQEIA